MQKVRLKSDGIGTEFVFADIRSNSGYVDVRISVDLPEEMGRWPMPMAACRLFKGDLERLLQYFRSHTKGLLDGSLSESAFKSEHWMVTLSRCSMDTSRSRS